MKKAIIIGNGFSSQIIEYYKSKNLMAELKNRLPDELQRVENFFSKFRLHNKFENVEPVQVLYSHGIYEALDDGSLEGVQPWPTDLYIEPNIEMHIINALKEYGFTQAESVCREYFYDAGLVYEIYKSNISGIESPLKIIDMARKIKIIPDSLYEKFSSEINMILYNNGDFHLKYSDDEKQFDHTDKINKKKLERYFRKFKTIYTTNYDLILDDIFHNKVKHLHGGFCCKSFNQVDYSSSNKSEYIIVLGVNGTQKLGLMKHKKSNQTLFMSYLNKLASEDLDELYILGYSGENDQHINEAIRNNHLIKKVIYYCEPDKVSNASFHYLVSTRFVEQKKECNLESWNVIWEKIK
ncbi:hypothetical protein ACHOLT_17730 [Desulfitobacterium sp. Sab5]|uniref:hypothetical protein n=1 Tax=Desulfitobacterium nosdiversum TaxID=3375356 RepID=UPI003CF0D36A